MRDDGVTADNVAVRSPRSYTNPVVRVDTLGRIQTDIMVTEINEETLSALRASRVHVARTYITEATVQGWGPI